MPFISEVESIYIQRFYTGWMTLRNQLATPIKLMGRRVIELYDALIAGNDWEVTPYLSLKRRAGHTFYVALTYPAMAMYSWKSNTQGTVPIFDTTNDIEYVRAGQTATTFITNKGLGNGLQSSILGIGNFLYVGNPAFNFKWDGPSGSQGKTNWGISNAAMTVGPNTAATGANSGSTGVSWVNPGNVSSAVSYATQTTPGSGSFFVKTLNATNFSLGISSTAQITGIQLSINMGQSLGSAGGQFQVVLLKNGTQATIARSIAGVGSTPATVTLGGISDLWGGTFTPTDVNNSGFGIGLFYTGGSNNNVISVNNVQITIYTGTTPSPSPTGSGSFTAVNGYSYVVAYGNATSGEISNGSIPSASTGPFTNKQYVGVPVIASTDPQVNQIHVSRTTDSGGGNQYFEISNSPFANSSATIQDTTPDVNLQVTSQAEINLGNTPPPAGLVNLEWFAGRMWGSTNNLLWASTGPETLSGNAPNSNWNPLFQWVIPQPIVRNVRGPNGMLVFTVDDCYIVRGTDITNYTVNEFVKDFGIRSYNAVDTDGTNLYVFTSDRQFILLSASGAQDIGLAIADQLLNVDPTQCYVKVNRYGLDSIVRILDPANNVYYDYNLNQQCWNLPGLLAMPSCAAMGSIETSPGVWRLLLCSTSAGVSSLAYRDITQFTDLSNFYSPNAVFGSIQLADPGNLAKFGALGGFVMEYTLAGALPKLFVLPNDLGAKLSSPVGQQISGNFTALDVGSNPINWPPTLSAQPKTYRSVGYYYMYGKGLSGFVRHLQFQITAPPENTATELIGFGIFGDLKQETGQAGQLPQLQGR